MLVILCCMSWLILPASGQKISKPEDAGYTLFTIPFGNTDSVRFLVAGTDLKQKKPVFLFIHGSLPNPLLIFNDQHDFNVFPFRTAAYRDSFHFVTVCKPGIPVMAHQDILDDQMCYKEPSTGRFPSIYTLNNHLDYYIGQQTTVLQWLARQPWVDTSQLIVCGGSQGATVGAKLATLDAGITHLIYYSGNPDGRLDEEVRRIQQKVFAGTLDGAEAARQLDQLQQYWVWLFANAESTDDTYGDTPKASVSFSKPARDYLLQLTIPVLVAFGTADITAAPSATLAQDFLRRGKNNLTVKIYPNYDHHFFEKQPATDGQAAEPVYRMDDAMKEWMQWINHKPK